MTDFTEENEPVRLAYAAPIAFALIEKALVQGYQMIQAGELKVVPGRGRLKVPTHEIERLIGKRLSIADVKAAEARIAPKRSAQLAYLKKYRAEKAALAAKKHGSRGNPLKDKGSPNGLLSKTL